MFSVLTHTTLRRTAAAAYAQNANGVRWMSKNTRKSRLSQNTSSTAPKEADHEPPVPNFQEPLYPEQFPHGQPNLAELPSLDVSSLPAVAPAANEQRRTGARSSRDTPSSSELSRRNARRVFIAFSLIFVSGNLVYMGRDLAENEEKEIREAKQRAAIVAKHTKGAEQFKLPDRPTPDAAEDIPDVDKLNSSRVARTWYRLGGFLSMFTAPPAPLLLPPPFPPPQGKPYTLVISLDDLLVHSQWDRQHGWRTAKRPGVDYFLAYISQWYEVVVWTGQNGYTAEPILNKLDPFNFFITHRLFRESTSSISVAPIPWLPFLKLGRKVVKDLSYLNRDLSKVVVLDTNPDSLFGWEENGVIIHKWTGDKEKDQQWGSKPEGLVSLIPFLESIAIFAPPDVRPILASYRGKQIPLEYAKAEAAAKEKFLEGYHRKHPQGSRGLAGSAKGLSSAFGLNRDPMALSTSASLKQSNEPLTYLEQKRAEAQRNYLEEKAFIERNRKHLEELLEKDKEAMIKQMGGGTLWGLLAGAPPQPSAEGQTPPQDPQLQSKPGTVVPIS